jgi:hypothetical protein
MEELGNNTEMAAEIALCPLWYAFTALHAWLVRAFGGEHIVSIESAYPSDQDVLRQRRVRVLDLDKGELDAAIGEFVYQVEQFTLCRRQRRLAARTHHASAVSAGVALGPASGWQRLNAPTWVRRTSGALNLQNALFPAIVLEGADKWGSHSKDSPLAVCGRACLGPGRQRGVDDVLVAARDVGPVGGRVERGHGGEGCVWDELCGDLSRRGRAGWEGEESGTGGGALAVCAVGMASSVRAARMGGRMRIADGMVMYSWPTYAC